MNTPSFQERQKQFIEYVTAKGEELGVALRPVFQMEDMHLDDEKQKESDTI